MRWEETIPTSITLDRLPHEIQVGRTVATNTSFYFDSFHSLRAGGGLGELDARSARAVSHCYLPLGSPGFEQGKAIKPVRSDGNEVWP